MGMKGQYFIVASIIFSSIFFSTMLLVVTPEFIPESEHRELVYFMENLLQEYPYAFDDGINNSKELGYLKNFTLFARQIGAEHNIELHALWFFTKYNNSLNITIGNFLNESEDVQINISGNVKEVHIEKDSVNSTSLVVPEVFNLTIIFYNTQETLLLDRYKFNFYSYIELRKKRVIMEGDVLA